tara:strand:- start:635 stop:916 length:282 start_codon:yes stop_codon:yes gene_type:complete
MQILSEVKCLFSSKHRVGAIKCLLYRLILIPIYICVIPSLVFITASEILNKISKILELLIPFYIVQYVSDKMMVEYEKASKSNEGEIMEKDSE